MFSAAPAEGELAPLMMSDDSRCAECGAPLVDGMDCWSQMGAICAWEWQDPELAALHFVTVASYNLQHPAQFAPETLANLQAVYIEHLDHGLPVAEIRRRIGAQAEGARRVLIPPSERRPVLRRWPLTVADVYIPDQPQGAADRVRAWAASIRRALD